ncbi:MAG: bifunctional riboflavin kinase/FAD synthetase [Cytophagales bacterium]
MKVYTKISEFKTVNKAVCTVGMFDGVHIGHRKIMTQLQQEAHKNDAETVVVTFDPHPRLYFDKNNSSNLRILTDVQERIETFSTLGIQHLLIIPFDDQLANMSSYAFINDVIKQQIGAQTLLLGYDHRFGKNREGGFEYLQQHQEQLGIHVVEISRLDIDNAAVSSTQIRNYLAEGAITKANQLLGRNYSLYGTVVKGKQLGRTIHVPTANIMVENPYKMIPQNGVYVAHAIHKGQKYGAMMNIGTNPTVSHTLTQKIEAHIFDFNEEIYGDTLHVELIDRLRDEQKFDNLSQLVAQLQKDKQNALQILNHIEKTTKETFVS